MKEKELLSSLIKLMDPLQLINWSCPIDEYNSEINKIYDYYKRNNDFNIISKELDKCFNYAINNKFLLVEELFKIYVSNQSINKDYIVKTLLEIWDPLAIDNKTFNEYEYDIYVKKILDNYNLDGRCNEKFLVSLFLEWSPRKDMISIFNYLLSILIQHRKD